MRILTERCDDWALQSVGLTGTVTEDTAHARNIACAKCAGAGESYLRGAYTGALGTTYFHRAAVRYATKPASNLALLRVGHGFETITEISLHADGTLTCWNPKASVNIGSASGVAAEETWYVVEVKLLVPAAGNGTIAWRVLNTDGSVFRSEQSDAAHTTGVATPTLLQAGKVGTLATTVYVADVGINDSTGTANNSYFGASYPEVPSVPSIGCYLGATMDGDVAILESESVRADAPLSGSGIVTWDRFEAHAGKKQSLVQFADTWLTWDNGTDESERCHERGAIPYKSIGGGAGICKKVLEGKEDAAIKTWAEAAAAFKHPFFLRLWWEANAVSGFGFAENATQYVEAWRYVYNKVHPIAPNATFAWCPNILLGAFDPEAFYPGDEYVHWTGIDGYNGENPKALHGWRTPLALIRPTYQRILEIAPSKPMLLGEFACSEYLTTAAPAPPAKAEWLTSLFATLKASFPAIRAAAYFNWNIEKEPGVRLDWPIETSESATAAYAKAVADPYFRGPVANLLSDLATVPAWPPAPPGLRRKPPLALDWEVETPNGTFRLPSDSSKARNRPSNGNFSTQRGDGFGIGSLLLNRQIFRDYPDIGLLDTWRAIGRNGEVAYEGRLQSDPRTNDPSEQIQVQLVGWMSYLKNRKAAPLIIDRRLSGWGEMSMEREAVLRAASVAAKQFTASVGFQDAGTTLASGISFAIQRLIATYAERGEQWFYGGGEAIGALRYDFYGHGEDVEWEDRAYLSTDDLGTVNDLGTDHDAKASALNQSVTATAAGRKYAFIETSYLGATTGDVNLIHRWVNLAVLGNHGLTERGTWPEIGFYVSDIIEYVLATYAPKLVWAGQQNTFPVQQAAWQDSPAFPYDIIQQLNNLVLWETNVWENREFHFEAADLTKNDWQIRTDDPGVTVVFQGDSIENFANGVITTYTDFAGVQRVLYPPDHEELRDENEANPANRHGEELWTEVEVPWPTIEGEALQFGRTYLAEYNRPKRPGTFRIAGGYIQDFAGHWHQGWKVRNSETLGIMDHPADEPRLITGTTWDEEAKTLEITVDAPSMILDAIIARQSLAREAAGLS